MSQQITEQNFQVIIRVRPLNCKQQEQIQAYEYAQSKKFKNSSNNKTIKLSPMAYAFYTKFYNVTSLNDIMKVENNNTVYVIDTEYKNSERKMKPYVFSHVYNQKQTSEEIFQSSIFEQMQCIFQGYNYTILAYGITGSGKTHTVFGSHERNQKGICGLALNYLLKKKKQLEKDGQMKINLGFSFVQIYNQNVRDLLNSQGKMLNIIEDSKGNTSLTDAIQIQIHNQDQIHDLINIGLAKRSSGATMANQYSSRSHAILQMNVQILTEKARINSKMFIIDLAGSEKIQTLNTAKKMQQGANINKSLLALGNCINILAQNSKRGVNGSVVHIPYRDSKLTRILKDSLGGNAKTLMISCVSQNPFTIQETITTLNYAQRAQGIKKQLKKNRLSEQDQKRLCCKCMEQINGESQVSIQQKIRLPQSLLRSSVNQEKNDMMESIFEQVYEEIIENIKEKISIESIFAAEGKYQTSSEQIEKIRWVNQNQRIQLKQTMWKLFNQKQQDYNQKISELNSYVQNFNQQQEKLQRSKSKSRVSMRKAQIQNQQSNQTWNLTLNSSKRNSTQKFRSVSLSRRPLESRQNNQEQNISEKKNGDDYKFLLSGDCQENRVLNEESNNVRFSFASLLTSDVVNKNPTESENDINRSAEKLTKRKKSRSKFEVVKKMSASKLDSNSKEFNEVSI